MRRFTLFVAVAVLAIGARGIFAQEELEGSRIYVALYKIKYSDIPEWAESYHEHVVPVLEELVSEEMISAFNVRMHHTGGEYNIREGYVGDADTNFQEFVDAYLGRLAQRHPAVFERMSRMMLAHADEIWNIESANLPDPGTSQYAYEAQFQVNFADMERWNELWNRHLIPVAEQAMSDGLLQGYVVEGHNTGGRFNWKILYMLDDWDAFDEVEAAFFEAAPLDHPIWSMFTAHKDELWQELPPSN